MATNKKIIKKTDVKSKGTPIDEIASNFGLSVSAVIKELKNLGIKKKLGTDEISDKQLEEIINHFDKVVKELKKAEEAQLASAGEKEIHIKLPIIVKNLAEALGKKPAEVIMGLMKFNVLASINQVVDAGIAEKVCRNYGFKLIVDAREKTEVKIQPKSHEVVQPFTDDPKDLVERPPVVTFMGHVDHGKTSIQDAIRKTNVVKGEAGGITQHTGASVVTYNGKTIVFIDTPGHEAFTAMRARGANVTDIVVLVVAADDGFMPQTVEAMNHAKAAEVPIIVAINKMDLPSANPEKVLIDMQKNNLMCEEWGGEVGVVKVSAIKGTGLNDLLDRVLLEAEVLELKANPKRVAEGIILEAQLEQGQGPTASVIIQNGTLNVGDIVLSEQHYGKVKALIDYKGERVKSVSPGLPVKVVGFSGVPTAGAKFRGCTSEKEASELAGKRAEEIRSEGLTKSTASTLEELLINIDKTQLKTLNLVVKTDVQGTSEAIRESLNKFQSEKISVNIIHSAVGAITESDILLASASKAIVVGFHVKVNSGVNDIAKKHNIEIRLYTIIYELIEDIKDALEGKLAPEQRERHFGKARILKIFDVSKGPKICGCIVEEGSIKINAKARVYRNKELIFNGIISSLRRFQDDVSEVKNGNECGIRLNNFLDFQENDFIDVYDIEFRKATL